MLSAARKVLLAGILGVVLVVAGFFAWSTSLLHGQISDAQDEVRRNARTFTSLLQAGPETPARKDVDAAALKVPGIEVRSVVGGTVVFRGRSTPYPAVGGSAVEKVCFRTDTAGTAGPEEIPCYGPQRSDPPSDAP